MRFDGSEKFKTHCEALATLVFFLAMGAVFVVNLISIMQGKIQFSTWSITNRYSREFPESVSKQTAQREKHYLFGFSLESSDLRNSSFVETTALLRDASGAATQLTIFDCTQDVYSRLSERSKYRVPLGLEMRCARINSRDLNAFSSVKFVLKKCQELKSKTNPKCAASQLLEKSLTRFKVWSFTLADERDFSERLNQKTSPFEMKFVASRTYGGLAFRKRFSVFLEDVELRSRKGLINFRLQSFPSKIFLREEADTIPRDGAEDPVLVELRLKADPSKRTTIQLQYSSLFSMVAMFGGFSKGLTLLSMTKSWAFEAPDTKRFAPALLDIAPALIKASMAKRLVF